MNLEAKEFIPKLKMNQNQQNMPNSYMGYGMNSPYGYYSNQYQMPMGPYGYNQDYMNQPQI